MAENRPVRVLQIVGSMHPGGMENFIMNLYGHVDPEQIQFDFVVHKKSAGDYCDSIENMGGTVYELPRMTSHPLKNLRMLASIIKNGKYDVAVRHTANALAVFQLMAAKHAGAKTICHSHNTTDPQKALHYFSRLFMRAFTDERFACSDQAGKWMFGGLDYKVIHNAIDIDAFRYNSNSEKEIREESDCKDSHIYVNIANFIDSKNHMYLLEIFRKIADIDPKALCLCLGDGANRGQIEDRIKELRLEKTVRLAGVRRDIPKIMSAADVLIFPSKFEGLPLTLIEGQSAGLPMLISDTITEDVVVTEGIVRYMSIELEPQVWADEAYETAVNSDRKRICQRENIAQHGYDINELAIWYIAFCRDLADGKRQQ